MLTSSRIQWWSLAVVLVSSWASLGEAKGLTELSQSNPANEAPKAEKAGVAVDGQKPTSEAMSHGEEAEASSNQGAVTDQKLAAPVEKSGVSKAISGRLALGTSYGWILGSKTSGKWSAKGGMSDVSVSYKVRTIAKVYDAIGTYRYAPISVQGIEDSQSYRGIWEVHYLGGKIARQVKNLLAFGTLEMGYAVVHVLPTDGLSEKSSAQGGGFSLTVGGGGEYKVAEQFFIGPRLNVGVGSIRTLQVAGVAGFVF